MYCYQHNHNNLLFFFFENHMHTIKRLIEKFGDISAKTTVETTNETNNVSITNNKVNSQNMTQIEEVLNDQDLSTTISQAVDKTVETIVQTQQEINQANAAIANMDVTQTNEMEIDLSGASGINMNITQANEAKMALQQSSSIQSVIQSSASNAVKAVTADILGASAGQDAVVQTQQEFQALAKAIQDAEQEVAQSADANQEVNQSGFRARIEPFVRRIVFKRKPSLFERFMNVDIETDVSTTTINNNTVQSSTDITDINEFQSALNRSDVKQMIEETYAESLIQKSQNVSSNVQSLQNTCSACAKVAQSNKLALKAIGATDVNFTLDQSNKAVAEMAQSYGMFLEQSQCAISNTEWDSSTSQYANAGQASASETSQGGSTEGTGEQTTKQSSDQSATSVQSTTQTGNTWIMYLVIGIVVIAALAILTPIIMKAMKNNKGSQGIGGYSMYGGGTSGYSMRGGRITSDRVYY